jgi:hypothetical protein
MRTCRHAMRPCSWVGVSTACAWPTRDQTLPGHLTLAVQLREYLPGRYSHTRDGTVAHSGAAGMTNTAGAIPGIIGVVTTGAILDLTGSWPLALFVPSIFFFVTGAAC